MKEINLNIWITRVSQNLVRYAQNLDTARRCPGVRFGRRLPASRTQAYPRSMRSAGSRGTATLIRKKRLPSGVSFFVLLLLLTV